MTPVRNCLVVGAGIGGLGAAVALRQQGIDVDVVEIKPDAHVVGVGINQPGNSLRALDVLGVLEECLDVGYQFDRNEHFDWQGRHILLTPCSLGTDRVPPNNALARADLHRILGDAARRAGVNVRYGASVADLVDDGDGVTVTFTDGRVGRYDAAAAFDGIRSPMRRRLFGAAVEPEYTGFAVWRVTMPRPAEVTHTMLFHGDRSNTGVIPLSPEHMYLLHVTAEPEDARYEDTELAALLRQRLAGYGGLVAQLRDTLPDDGVVYSPISEVHLPAPWHRGRVIVLGDAAHASAPNLTQGAAMALEDAVVLADELARDRPVVDSLAAVSDMRFARTKLVQDVSHGILATEMAITADGLEDFAANLREHLPGQAAFVEAKLNEHFRLVADPVTT
ncbi:FAD-dependent monooxygenase [Georgenia yuyongxinii]|nr:FAD-dependent monooxygenase [Georgenia yuyongxinii]